MKLIELGQSVRELATVVENENLVVSCYVDLKEGGPAQDVTLRQRVETLRATLPPEQVAEFDEALKLIESYLAETPGSAAKGAAFFVRRGDDPFFIELLFQIPFESWIGVDGVPNIYHLVEMKDRYHRYVVILCGSESVRVLEVNLGAVTAEVWKERPELRERVGREWTKQHYQRHEKAVTDRFLKEAVEMLRRGMEKEGYRHLILVGNSVTLARVEPMLPKALRDVVVTSLVMGKQDNLRDVVELTLAAFVEEEERESLTMVEELEHHLYKTGLAVVGASESRSALHTGAADVLVLSTRLSEGIREELVRLAEKTSAQVELVEDSLALARLGGVGCLLRYRPQDSSAITDDKNVVAETANT